MCPRSLLVPGGIAMVVLTMGSSTTTGQKEHDGQSLKPLITVSGIDSKITTKEIVACNGKRSCAQVLERHFGKNKHMIAIGSIEVEFASFTMVAIFDGSAKDTSGVYVDSIRKTDDVLVVDYHIGRTQSDFAVGLQDSCSYGIVFVPKFVGKVRIREGTKANVSDPYSYVLTKEVVVTK